VDLNKLSTGDKVIGGSGIALFILSFFPWFGIDIGGIVDVSYSENGWSSIFSMLAILIGIAMAVLAVLPAFGVELPELGMPWSQIHFIAGIVAAALILLQLLVGSSTAGVDLDRKIGVFLGLLAGIGLAAGGFLRKQEGDEGSAPAGPPQAF
jgi:hypothetical protein